jgi:phosphopantothenoylcysteine decarboxylase/phosphopantothenate--cysteine ligase
MTWPSTVLLATDKPVLVAPAMNVRMWLHPRRRRRTWRRSLRGACIACGPDDGAMACGEFGAGADGRARRRSSAAIEGLLAGPRSRWRGSGAARDLGADA